MPQIFQNKLSFLDVYQPFLREDEITNGLMIGLLERDNLIPDLMISVTQGDSLLLGTIVGKNMILASNTTDRTLYNELVSFMDTTEYPGIIGPKTYCDIYKQVYDETHETPLKTAMNQRIYACHQVNNVSEDIGLFRLATKEDIDILTPWIIDFEIMVEGSANEEDLITSLMKRIESEVLYVLEMNGEVVSMAQRARPLKTTETVGLVYTPIKHRKKGYATRVVELLTILIHQDGKIATLYTDLSNPTSNKIYMDIGYQPHCDSIVYIK